MAPLDGSIVNVAMPTIGTDLSLSVTAAMWVSAAFLLATAVLLIPSGRLADQYGRVRFYLLGILVFTLASLVCAASMDAAWLIAGRIIQGAGGALMIATSAAIVTAVFPPKERGRALGVNVMAVYVALVTGGPLGGFVVHLAGWRWIFLINLPIGLIVLVWGWFMLPRDERATEAPRLDLAGAVLLGVFLVSLLVPLTFLAEWGLGSPRSLGLMAVAATALVAFIGVESRVAAPILDLELVLKNRLFAAANAAALLNYMGLFGISWLTANFLQLVQGRSPVATGWLLMAMPLLMAALSPLSGHISDRIGSRGLTSGGMALIATGMLMLGFTGEATPLWQFALYLAVVGLGMAAFSAPNTSAVMGSVQRTQLSQASAFLGTMRTAGQALSVALLGGIATSGMGAAGARMLFSHHGDGVLADQAVASFADGYGRAMLVGAALAVLGALVSLTRGEPGGGVAAREQGAGVSAGEQDRGVAAGHPAETRLARAGRDAASNPVR